MPIYRPTPIVPGRHGATMQVFRPSGAQTPSSYIPNPPDAPVLTNGSGSDLTVTWTAPSTDSAHGVASSFNLQSSPSGAANWTTVSGVTSPYDLSGLAAGVAIDVQVQSANAAGLSAWSATSTLTTAVAITAPNAPSLVSLATGAGSDLTVIWTAPVIDATHGAATSFNLRSSPSGAANWTTVTGVTSPYDLSGLAVAAAIDVQIQGTNAGGAGAWSATSTLTTAVAAPNPPASVLLAQGTGSDLTVTWTAPPIDATHSAATGFNLQSSPSGAAQWTTVSAVTSPYDLSGLAAGVAIDVQVQSTNAAGPGAWSATSTLTTATTGPFAPNTPAIARVVPPPDGTTGHLAVSWTAAAVDATHGAATGFNIRFSPTGAGTWTTMTGVSSPYTITGLAGGAAIDVQVQATNAAASPSAWSATTTATTWGTAVAPGNWSAAAAQTQGTPVAPYGGVQMTLTPAPTVATAAAFAWSTSPTTIPTTGLLTAIGDGQPNGWGQYISAPSTAGTFYLWMLAQGAAGTTSGALVTSAITVS